jgi:hypothetical protein
LKFCAEVDDSEGPEELEDDWPLAPSVILATSPEEKPFALELPKTSPTKPDAEAPIRVAIEGSSWILRYQIDQVALGTM